MISGRTNDEVAAAPASAWTSDGEQRLDAAPPGVRGADRRRARAPRRARRARARGRSRRARSRSRTSTRCCSPGGTGIAPVTKRELVRYAACIAPTMLPVPLRPAVAPAPLPRRHRPPGLLAAAGTARTRRTWIGRWLDDADDAEPDRADRGRLARRARVAREPRARSSCTRGRRGSTDGDHPTYALVDIDPGPDTTMVRRAAAGAAARDRARPSRCARVPEGDRPAGHPDLDPDRPGPDVRRDARVGRDALAHGGPGGARARELVVGEGGARRVGPASTTRRTRATRRWSRRTAPRPAPGAPVSVPIAWDELDDPELAPDRWTIHTVLDRVATVGDPMREALSRPQTLPALELGRHGPGAGAPPDRRVPASPPLARVPGGGPEEVRRRRGRQPLRHAHLLRVPEPVPVAARLLHRARVRARRQSVAPARHPDVGARQRPDHRRPDRAERHVGPGERRRARGRAPRHALGWARDRERVPGRDEPRAGACRGPASRVRAARAARPRAHRDHRRRDRGDDASSARRRDS